MGVATAFSLRCPLLPTVPVFSFGFKTEDGVALGASKAIKPAAGGGCKTLRLGGVSSPQSPLGCAGTLWGVPRKGSSPHESRLSVLSNIPGALCQGQNSVSHG